MSRSSEVKRTPSRKPASRSGMRKSGGTGKQARPRAKTGARAPARGRVLQKWSAAVTRGSNALDLESRIFTKSSPKAIALSLKRSAERSRRRKSAPFRSAMSMLSFYINRAGKNLPRTRLQVLARAKGELRKTFGRG